jgi:hypothetical protein
MMAQHDRSEALFYGYINCVATARRLLRGRRRF